MALLVPAPHGAYVAADSVPTTPTIEWASSLAAVLGASNAKASWQEVISDTLVTVDFRTVHVLVSRTSLAATRTDALLDIGIDPAGGTTYGVLIPDLLVGWTGPDGSSANYAPRYYRFDVLVPRGSALAVRGQSSQGAAQAARVAVWLDNPIDHPDAFWTAQSVTAYGVTSSAASNGTSVTPGNDTTWSSWVSIGSTTDRALHALVLGIGGRLADTANSTCAYQAQMGVGSQPVSVPYMWKVSTDEVTNGMWPPAAPCHVNIPSGSQLQARARGISGSVEAHDIAIYGLA